MTDNDNVTPIHPAATVADLKAAMNDRHGRGMSDAEARLNSLSVEVVKTAAAEKITRTATDLADLGRLLADNRARLTTDPNDPIAEAHRLIVSLIQDYGVVEYLNGRGARRSGQGRP
ncbi:hypothetical protein CVAR_2309 [Corynebacterium variabile DSM 44702]|uniref:Uncharacterized protein n=1 Tax=Corynebacterium variabile (strain DSM 44702 / CIP 107183 / JCM 12073 / NCIMB 30131) TaxID=858619 RepID=G0HGP7_CORVD|nr:hypothetical protein [Corynebacterium variabile]AEK37654.1 hypothetical protein CVAR_2309 [Corynebacterium variabile DSM 44702]